MRNPDPALPKDLTVVLPVRNEAASIDAVLGDLLAQDFPPGRLEILVVDGRSTDDTRARVEAVARRNPRVRLLDNPRRLASGGRAVGAAAARGRFVLFVDGHCRIPSRTLLKDTLDLFERTGADCLARPQPVLPLAHGLVPRAIAAARTSPFGHSVASDIYGDHEGPTSPVSAGAAYRRSVFDLVGNFDPAFDACEDVEFNWRVADAGLTCWTSPRLAVAYEPRRTLRGLFRQLYRYGVGRARVHRKHPQAFTPECLVPVGFVLGMLLLPAARILGSPWGWLLVAPYLLYAGLNLLFSVRCAAHRGWRLLLLLPFTFLLIHVALGTGYLSGRLEPRPRYQPHAARDVA